MRSSIYSKARESAIEKKVTKHATQQGWISYKWASPNHRGVPDRLFFKNGQVLVVEFKAPGKDPSKLQTYVHEELGDAGFPVYVIDCVKTGMALFSNE